MNAVKNGVRFPVVPAGRRSGKSERFKRFLSKESMLNPNEKYFAAAPTRDQAKKIFWDDLKLMTFSSSHKKPPSETELKIFMPNGTEIHVLGLDKPQRIEGINWTGGGIDEIADVKSEAVQTNIMPALNTVDPRRADYRTWCWFLGVPDGLNHYYDMSVLAASKDDKNYGLYHWKSADILPKDVIDLAKKTMSRKHYLQEYEASFETATGRIYDDYSSKNHVDYEIKEHEQLMWHHDFNYTPLSSGIAVKRDGNIYILDEIILESAIAQNSAQEFVERYKDHKNKKVLIYGDPAGKAGEKHGQASSYTQIEDMLRSSGWTFERRVKRAAPAIRDRQNAVRAMILNADGESRLFVNPAKAKYADKGLSTVQLKKGSTFLEMDKKHQHITTAIGYMFDYEFPIEKYAEELKVEMMI